MKLSTLVLPLAMAAFASPAFAGDCNYNKSAKAETSIKTAQMSTDARIHQAGYNSGKSYKKASNTIVDAAVGTADLSTLVAAVKAAGLVDTLSGDGPFTVFAPTNAAFDGLPSGTVATLLEPANKGALTEVLTAHVVAGKLSASDIISAVSANGGKTKVQTLSGEMLTVKLMDGQVVIKDENGGMSTVTTADVGTSNGVVHIINNVILPGADNS